MPRITTRKRLPRLDGRLRDESFYHEIGFRSGLEIHQQLRTRGKLFCRCPAGLYSKQHDAVLLRHMRPTLSELGEYDGTALMEFKTRKEVLYLLNAESVCTYEMDDTPPFPPDEEAIEIALEIMLLLHCKPVGEMHISRKQYLDGSIPTGFQRTAILGVEGEIPYAGRAIGIYQLALEEDSCREVSDQGHRITFRTDRLSIPLVEVVTKPEMRTPMEVAEVCERLGRLLRVTGKVRRGIGATRQDVNVSVTGGSRVEIKGVGRIPAIPALTHNEALRQVRLLSIRDRARELGITEGEIDAGADAEVGDLLEGTRVAPVREASARGQSIRAVRLPRFQKLLLTPVQPGLPFAQEFSGRVRVIACLDTPQNLFVRGEKRALGIFRQRENRAMGLPEPRAGRRGPSDSEWERIASRLGASDEDGILLVFGPREDTETAIHEIRARAREALSGVPNETRQPFPIGTTDFERILPGPDRMYPDTDLPPIPIAEERIRRAAARLPEYPWDREDRYLGWGIDPGSAKALAISPRAKLLERAVGELGTNPKDAARLLHQVWKDLGRRVPLDRIPEEEILSLLREIAEGRLHREGFPQALAWLAAAEIGNRARPRPQPPGGAGALGRLLLPWLRDTRAEMRVSENGENLIEATMGVAMTRLAGVVPGREVREILEQLASQETRDEVPQR